MAIIQQVKYKIILGLIFIFMLLASSGFANDYDDSGIAIMGEPVATPQQCLNYLLSINPDPYITVSPEELINNYYEEAGKEGIRADIAFAQALQETGFFRYGGLVKGEQNNYCGLGSVGSYDNGAWFETSQIGVRAHIQHLLAYSTTRMPNLEIVDPRYYLVMTTANFGQARNWEDLNGRWAIPGYNYGQKILRIYYEILAQ